MKIVAIIPIKKNSKRVKGKNFKKIRGKPLYYFLLKKIKKCNFDSIYVDTDSNEIKKFCFKNNINYVKRQPKLAKDNANGNDLLIYHAKIIKADIYFQLFVTAPLLSVTSINKCINIIKKNKKYDSIMTIKKIYSWFWYKNCRRDICDYFCFSEILNFHRRQPIGFISNFCNHSLCHLTLHHYGHF